MKQKKKIICKSNIVECFKQEVRDALNYNETILVDQLEPKFSRNSSGCCFKFE